MYIKNASLALDMLFKKDLLENVSEDVRLSVLHHVMDLINNRSVTSVVFPSSFTALERCFVHLIANILGLKTMTSRSGMDKTVSLHISSGNRIDINKQVFKLTQESERFIMQLMQTNPLTPKERLDLASSTENLISSEKGTREERQRGTTGRLMGAVPQVPPACPQWKYGAAMGGEGTAQYLSKQWQLIYQRLEEHNAVVVYGPPGCGKTSYLPQLLLEECHRRNQKCRMICSEPRRLYAHINAERLAELRGEPVGQTVGYQIRLESKVSPRTLLTFCTHGVLLRTIYADPSLMTGTTHILIDEIEEEELPSRLLENHFGFNHEGPTDTGNGCGILLGIIPWLVRHYSHLKVIFMVNMSKVTYDSLIKEKSQGKEREHHEKASASPTMKNISPTKTSASDVEKDQQQQLDINHTSSCQTTIESRSAPLLAATQAPTMTLQCDSHFASRRIMDEKVSSIARSWFESLPGVIIPYAEQKVTVCHLEEILEWVGYSNSSMEEMKDIAAYDVYQCQTMAQWLSLRENEIGTNQENQMTTNSSNQPGFSCATPPNMFQGVPNETFISSSATSNNPGPSVTSASRQHANTLLWTIWKTAMLQTRMNENKVRQEFSDNSEATAHLQRLLTNLHQCILAGWFPVDFQHCSSGLTALMICSAAGLLDSVERLLAFGADVFIRTAVPYETLMARLPAGVECPPLCGPKHKRVSVGTASEVMVGVNAFDLARLFSHSSVAAALKMHILSFNLRQVPENHEAVLLRFGSWFAESLNNSPLDRWPVNGDLNEECLLNNQKLMAYHVSRNHVQAETTVNFELLMSLLKQIDSCMPEGSILVFLPSYEEIIGLRERILNPDAPPWDPKSHFVYILHARMLVPDLIRVYTKPPPGIRKLILSTDIAEAVMTFEDVSYVVDCGLTCLKNHCDLTGTSTLKNQWISRSTAIQRSFRAGFQRDGICFRMYSQIRFASLEKFTAKWNGSHVLEEACIQSRMMAPPNSSITDLLSLVPRPPPVTQIMETVESLQQMNAIDASQELTELGYHLCDIPIAPQYAKMVLTSVALKCLDPILTIACILTYAEPFILPRSGQERREWLTARKKLAAESLSDHMMLLRAFQFWQKARSEGWEKSFCQKNFISSAAFEIITGIRTQLLGQLRASGFVKARGSGDIRDLNANSENWAVVKAAIVAGMSPRLARVNREQGTVMLPNSSGNLIHFHPYSVLSNTTGNTPFNCTRIPSDWIVYDQLLSCGNSKLASDSDPKTRNAEAISINLIQCATVVSPITVALMAGTVKRNHQVECSTLYHISQSNVMSSSMHGRASVPQCVNQTLFSTSANIVNAPISLGSHNEFDHEISSDSDSDEVWTTLLGPEGTRYRHLCKSQANPGNFQFNVGGVNGEACYHLGLLADTNFGFQMDSRMMEMVLTLRQKWQSLMLRRLRNPGKPASIQDEVTLSAIVSILTAEEHFLGLRQPTGVGSRPRPMAAELCNQPEYSSNMTPNVVTSHQLGNSCFVPNNNNNNAFNNLAVNPFQPELHSTPQLWRAGLLDGSQMEENLNHRGSMSNQMINSSLPSMSQAYRELCRPVWSYSSNVDTCVKSVSPSNWINALRYNQAAVLEQRNLAAPIENQGNVMWKY